MNLRAPLACLLIASLLLALPAPAFAEADRQFTFAARLMQQGENDLAQEAFEEFLSRFPDDRRISDVRYYMALLARKAGNHEQAERHLTHVDELRHVSPASLNLLRGQLALEAGEAEQAIEHLEAIKPDSLDDTETRATWHYLLATAYRSADNLDAAADHFDRASDAASSVRATAILELGKTRMQLNQPMAALEALRSALDESIPTAEAAEARYLVASLAYDQRHFDMAIEYYQQVTRQHQRSDYYRPAVIGLLRAMGAAEQNQDLLDRYENSRNQLAAGDQAEALYLAAAAHVRLAEYDQAIARLRDFQRRYDADHAFAGRVSYLRAVCLYQTDLAAFEAWLAELDAAESEVAQRPDLRYLRAQAAVRRDQHAAAIPHLTVLIETDDPEFAARSLRQRAGLNQQLGRTEAAADDYAAFAARFEDHPEAHDAARRAVDLAFRAGRLEQVPQLAADYLRRAEPGDAHAPAVRLRTALALMQLNRGNEALDELAQLLEADPDERLATIAHYYQGLLLASRAQLADDADAEATDPAIAALERALQGPLSDKQRAEAINLTARMHRMAGRESQALDLYDQLRRERSVDTFDPMAALWIGRGLHQRGSYEAALPWLETVIARAEDKPRALAEALYLAGEAHHARGDHDQAVTRFRQVVAYSQGYGDRGRLGLARALAATGEVDEALNEYEGLQHVEASAIAAAALLEGAQHRLALADRLERGGDATNAHAERTEARRQLNRVVILYDLPELGSLPSVAKLRLARLLHDLDRTDDARRRLTELADAVDSKPFRDLARAELTLLEGNRADAISLLRQVHTAAEDEAATAEANQRLQALGESP